MLERVRVLREWSSSDASRAVTLADRALGPGLADFRLCVLSNLSGPPRDCFSALAMLGREIALQSGSMSFAASEVDVLAKLVVPFEIAAARVALLEAYARALLEIAANELERAWDPPACVVLLGDAWAAVAAGHPTGDPEALSAWADRVAVWLVRARVRRVSIGGAAEARIALDDALALVGVAVEAR